MKSVFIVFNQANTERVEYMLDMLKISGFTFFEQFKVVVPMEANLVVVLTPGQK